MRDDILRADTGRDVRWRGPFDPRLVPCICGSPTAHWTDHAQFSERFGREIEERSYLGRLLASVRRDEMNWQRGRLEAGQKTDERSRFQLFAHLIRQDTGDSLTSPYSDENRFHLVDQEARGQPRHRRPLWRTEAPL